MRPPVWVIMAAGTGGHVIPALAVAQALRTRGYEVVWLGTPQGIEQRLVPEAGFPLEVISIGGVRRKGFLVWLKAPFRVFQALRQALHLLKKHRPIAVLGMGGFVTVPGGLAAKLLGIPLVIHEQNAIPGLANKLLKRWASRVLVAFPKTFAEELKVVQTGNPVRSEIASLPLQRVDPSRPLHLLVMGGSLGARALNTVVEQLYERYPTLPWLLWHQMGPKEFKAFSRPSFQQRREPFIKDVAQAYAWADLVLCRAGAMTVFELAAAGKPSILVPYPFAVDDHQRYNAAYLSEAGAAILVSEPELTAEHLFNLLSGLAEHPEVLIEMAHRAKQKACPEATMAVVHQCLEVCGVK